MNRFNFSVTESQAVVSFTEYDDPLVVYAGSEDYTSLVDMLIESMSCTEARKEQIYKELVRMAAPVEELVYGDLRIDHFGTFFRGHKVDGLLAALLVRVFREDSGEYGKLALHRFLENLFSNTSEWVREQLFPFLRHNGISITADGCFIAYKAVEKDGFSVRGNTSTIVLSGETDNRGRIKNTVGAVIAVSASSVDSDPTKHCSYGLHVGTYEYATDYGLTYASDAEGMLLLAKVNPMHVISVPDNGRVKLRVSQYEVLGLAPMQRLNVAVYRTEEQQTAQLYCSECGVDCEEFEHEDICADCYDDLTTCEDCGGHADFRDELCSSCYSRDYSCWDCGNEIYYCTCYTDLTLD